MIRPTFLRWGLGLAAVLLSGFSHASERTLDPVYVFYPRAGCLGNAVDLEVWNRDTRTWRPHPTHPRVPLESCQLEDAGTLLNETRWRCVEGPSIQPAAAWVVGLDVFDPEIMERCTVDRRSAGGNGTWIHISAPRLDEPVRNESQQTSLEGSVRLDGTEGAAYDVILAIDVSDRTRSEGLDLLEAQVNAARSFVARMAPRLGDVRIGVVSYPNLRPSAGSLGGTGARRELAPSPDPVAIDASLRRLLARGEAGYSSFAAGLSFAVEEVVGRLGEQYARSNARKAVLIAADGRPSLPFGSGEDENAKVFTEQTVALARGASSAGVVFHLFALGGLAAEPLPVIQALIARPGSSFTRVLRPKLASGFFEQVALPYVREVRVTELRGGAEVPGVRLEPGGRFSATLPLVSGKNPIAVTALSSDGRRSERQLVLQFDDSLIRERLLEAERERMRQMRERNRTVVVEPEGGGRR